MKQCRFCYEKIRFPFINQVYHQNCRTIYLKEWILNYNCQYKKRIQKSRSKWFKKKYYNNPVFKKRWLNNIRWHKRISNGGFYSMPEGIRADLIKKTMEKICINSTKQPEKE